MATSNTPNTPVSDPVKKCGTVDSRDEYDFVAGGGFVVDLRDKKTREVEGVLSKTPAGSSLELFSLMIPEANAPGIREEYAAAFSAVLRHIQEIPLEMFEEHIFALVDKGFLEEGLILFEYLLSQKLTDFSRILEQIILLYSEWATQHTDESYALSKKVFQAKLDSLISLGEQSELISSGEKSRIRGLYFEFVVGDMEQAGEQYIAGLEEDDGPCYFQYGSFFAREGKLTEAKIYYTSGWEVSANTDCLLGLYGIAIQEDDALKVAGYGQIIRHFGLHKSVNSDPLKFLCNSTTSVETLYAVFESYPQFTKGGLNNLKAILEKKKALLSHDSIVLDSEGSNNRSIAYQRMDIMVFEMIAFGNEETIEEVMQTLSLSPPIDSKRYLSFLLPWLESTPSRSLQKQSIETPIWSDSIDDLSGGSEGVQSTISREKNLGMGDNFGGSGIMTYLRLMRSASLALIEGDGAIRILGTFIDTLGVLRRLGYGHIEEIDFLEEEFKRQKDSITLSEQIRGEWTVELRDGYKKYKSYVDTNWNPRTRANLVLEVLTGKKDIKSVKDPYFAIYILSEVLCFSPENIELLNDIIDYIFTLELEASDCAFIGGILSRMPFYEEASLDFLADANITDISVLESIGFAYRTFHYPSKSTSDATVFDKLEGLLEEKILSATRGNSFLDHVRKLYFRTKRKEPNNTRSLGVLSYLVGLVASKQGTYSSDWEFEPTGYSERVPTPEGTPGVDPVQNEKKDPSNPMLAEKFYKISAGYGYLPAQETLAAIYKDRKNLEESRKYTALSNAQSGYTTWAQNQFSFALEEGSTTEAFEYIRLARLDDIQRADSLALEYSIRGGIPERTAGLKFLVGQPQLIGSLHPETIGRYIQHAKYLARNLAQKPTGEWELEDLIISLDILRFQYDSCNEEFGHLDEVTYDRVAAERAYNYWTQLVQYYKIGWARKPKMRKEKNPITLQGRRAMLYHFSNFFRRETDERGVNNTPDLSRMNDIYGDRRDLGLAAMSFPEHSKVIQDVLDNTIIITATEFLDGVESTSIPMLEVKHLIAIFLSRLSGSDTGIAKAIGIEGLSGDELFNALVARDEAIKSNIH